MAQTVSPEALKEVLNLDPETGILTWKRRITTRGNAGVNITWNAKNAGKKACNCQHTAGYWYGQVLGVPMLAHRVVWAMYHGFWPRGHIDHINGDPSDNRISNLRDVTPQQNQRNQKRFSTNTSGHAGVYWHKGQKKWVASIKVNYRLVHLGTFGSKSDAIMARRFAERQNGFDEMHGRR